MADEEKNDFKQLLEKVTRILYYLENDDSTGRKGIFYDVEDIKNRIKKIEDRYHMQKGALFIVSLLGGFIFWLIREVWLTLTS